MLTIIIKLLSDNPCNPLGLFPGTVIWKNVFQHEDDIAYIFLQCDCIELKSAITVKVFIKILRNGCGG